MPKGDEGERQQVDTMHSAAATETLPRVGPRPLGGVDEGELVARYRRGGRDEDFGALYQHAKRTVYRVCLHFLREPGAAEDACHDVFVQALERFSELRGDRFVAWVRRIAANHCLNRLRHRRVVERSAPELATGQATPSSEGPVLARQQLEVARRVLGALPGRQRKVFLLRYARELSYDEIQSVTGYTADQVRSYLQSSRRNFRSGWRRETQTTREKDAGED